MKCPKCGYLGFEPVDRCRNCGYEFSLTSAADALELPLKPAFDAESRQPLDDFSFLDAATVSDPVRPRENADGVQRVATSTGELLLFGTPIPDDLPLITRPSAPRPPLAVRRATPEVARIRSIAPRTATLDFEPTDRAAIFPSAHETRDETVARTRAADEDAPVGARLVAVAADLLILAAIDAAVVYFTMQICGIGIEDLGILPKAPLFAFLLVQNGGYLVAFTAGGQTLGKMAAGIRVVSAEPRSPLDLGRAFIRELMWFVLAAPAGLGLLTVLSRDRRGVHDRFAGTRVVRG